MPSGYTIHGCSGSAFGSTSANDASSSKFRLCSRTIRVSLGRNATAMSRSIAMGST